MVAPDDIRTGVKNILRLLGGHSHHGGILSIYHHEIRICLPLQLSQAAADAFHAGSAHHIANCQYFKVHSIILLLFSRIPWA